MTNRLPKQEPEIVDVQSFMEHHLADFIKERIKEGHSKAETIKWAADRFQKGAKYNLQSVRSPFLKRDTETGMITYFTYEEGQVYQVADADTVTVAFIDIEKAYDWDDAALDALNDKVRELQKCSIVMIWRMYTGMHSAADGGIQMISYAGGEETNTDGASATMEGSQTGTLMVSAMNILVQHDILELVGEAGR